MNKLITKFEITGECEIDVKKVVKAWNDRFVISQWHDEFTLCRHAKNAGNFTKTNLKVRISKQQAKELIVELDLFPNLSEFFKNGTTWRRKIDINPKLD